MEIRFIKEGDPFDYEKMDYYAVGNFISKGKFCFVGVYYGDRDDRMIVGYPKYIPYNSNELDTEKKREIFRHMKLVCTVAEEYKKSCLEKERYNPYIQASKTAYVNRMELAGYIIRDYVEYGIYDETEYSYTTDGRGIVDWNRTVQFSTPIIDGDTVVYTDIYSKVRLDNSDNMISKIHSNIVNETLDIYKWDDAEYAERPEKYPEIEGELKMYVPILQAKLLTVYSDREKELLKALIVWCNREDDHYEKYCIGNNSFEHVWEFAIDRVFGNVEDKESGAPFYYKLNTEPMLGTGGQIMDSLQISGASEPLKFYIWDAKYYVISESENGESSIKGAPAGADVAKQLGYFYYLYKMYVRNGNKITFYNSFLLPENRTDAGKLLNCWGYATQNNKPSKDILSKLNMKNDNAKRDLDKVYVYLVNPVALYKYVLNRRQVNEEILKEIDGNFVKPFWSEN